MEKITSTGILHPSPEPGGSETINRKRCHDLQRLLAAWPHEIADVSISGRQLTVRRLEKALRQERARARTGHWAYDVARHQQLARHVRAEQAALRTLETLERLGQTQKLNAQKANVRV